jgi:hypothetical protein
MHFDPLRAASGSTPGNAAYRVTSRLQRLVESRSRRRNASAPRSGATVRSGSRRSARLAEASGVSLGRDSSRGIRRLLVRVENVGSSVSPLWFSADAGSSAFHRPADQLDLCSPPLQVPQLYLGRTLAIQGAGK